MLTQLRHILIISLFTLTIFACKKDKNDLQSQIDILTSKNWKPATIDKNVSSNPVGKIYYYEENCNDFTYQFGINNSLKILKEKGCYVYKPDDVSGKYDLSAMEITYEETTYKIAEITTDQVKFYQKLPSSSGYDYVVYLLQ